MSPFTVITSCVWRRTTWEPVLVSLPVVVMRSPGSTLERKKSGSCFKVQPITVRKSRRERLEAAAHIVSTGRKLQAVLSAAHCPSSTYTVQDPTKERHRHRNGHQESSSRACPEPVSLLSLDSAKLTINTSHHKDFTPPLMVWHFAVPKQCWGYQYECFHRLWLLPEALLWTWKSVCVCGGGGGRAVLRA